MQKHMIYRQLRAKKEAAGSGRRNARTPYIYYMRARGRTYAVKHTAVKGKRQGGEKRAGRTHKAGEGNGIRKEPKPAAPRDGKQFHHGLYILKL